MGLSRRSANGGLGCSFLNYLSISALGILAVDRFDFCHFHQEYDIVFGHISTIDVLAKVLQGLVVLVALSEA